MVDELDSAILALLGRDGRMSYTSIAKRLGLSEGTVRNRVSRLIEQRALRIVALCNPVSLGLQALRLFISVDGPARVEEVCRALAALDHTNRVVSGTGSHDVYVEMTCRDLAESQRVLDSVRQLPGIRAMQVSMLTRFVKDHSWSGLRGGVGQQTAPRR